MAYRIEIKRAEGAAWEPGIDGYQDDRNLTDEQSSTVDTVDDAAQVLHQALEKGPFAIRLVDTVTGNTRELVLNAEYISAEEAIGHWLRGGRPAGDA